MFCQTTDCNTYADWPIVIVLIYFSLTTLSMRVDYVQYICACVKILLVKAAYI